MFETLLGLLSRGDIDQGIKVPIVENIFSFISNDQQVQLAEGWLNKGFVYKDEDNQ
jgi:hypothetical protein